MTEEQERLSAQISALLRVPSSVSGLPSSVLYSSTGGYFDWGTVDALFEQRHWGTYGTKTNVPIEDHMPLSVNQVRWYDNKDDQCPICVNPNWCPVNATSKEQCQERHDTEKASIYGAVECFLHWVNAVHTPEYHAEEGT